MTYPDYSGDYAFHPGVQPATVTTPNGTLLSGLHVRRDELTVADYSGAVVGLTPGDLVFILWGYAAGEIPIDSRLTTTDDSVSFTVIGDAWRGDRNQHRVFVRRRS